MHETFESKNSNFKKQKISIYNKVIMQQHIYFYPAKFQVLSSRRAVPWVTSWPECPAASAQAKVFLVMML